MMRLIVGLVSLVHLCESVPANFACSRKIQIGDAVMAGNFQSSTDISITLGTECGSILQTGTPYTPTVVGYDTVASTGNTFFLIDVSNETGDAFPGASFGLGSHLYNGKTLKPAAAGVVGNLTAWNTWTTTRLSPGTAVNCSARASAFNKSVTFSSPGTVTVRIAWSHGPPAVFVSSPCHYTVADANSTSITSTGETTPPPSGGGGGAGAGCPAPPREVCCTRILKAGTNSLSVRAPYLATLSSVAVWVDGAAAPAYGQAAEGGAEAPPAG